MRNPKISDKSSSSHSFFQEYLGEGKDIWDEIVTLGKIFPPAPQLHKQCFKLFEKISHSK